MARSAWLNPAARDYQLRKLLAAQKRIGEQSESTTRGPTTTTPDPGTSTDNVRTNPLVPGVAYVTTSVAQTRGAHVLVLNPSTLVRTDLVNPGVAWLTVTEVGP